jgi:hypothetical protein
MNQDCNMVGMSMGERHQIGASQELMYGGRQQQMGNWMQVQGLAGNVNGWQQNEM